jgi:hypothetical protein
MYIISDSFWIFLINQMYWIWFRLDGITHSLKLI